MSTDGGAPLVTRYGCFDAQVCVPKEFTDEQTVAFLQSEYPCGTENGWHVRKQGDPGLAGCNERVPCALHTDFVHIMLDA